MESCPSLGLPGALRGAGQRLALQRERGVRRAPRQDLIHHRFDGIETSLIITAERKYRGLGAAKGAEGARPHRSLDAARELLEQIRVCEQRTCYCNHVALARGEYAVDRIAVLKTTIRDDGNADFGANGGGNIGIGCGSKTPADAEQPSPYNSGYQIEYAGADVCLPAEIAHRIDEAVKAFIGIISRTPHRIGKAEPAIDVQVVDAESLQLPCVVRGFRQIVAEE